jgi:hypothetical protein
MTHFFSQAIKCLQKVKITVAGDRIFFSAAEFFHQTGQKLLPRNCNIELQGGGIPAE